MLKVTIPAYRTAQQSVLDALRAEHGAWAAWATLVETAGFKVGGVDERTAMAAWLTAVRVRRALEDDAAKSEVQTQMWFAMRLAEDGLKEEQQS
ncbi:hypothetical protein [Myxococcus llanfairpwllgwyngyllgogerychwyrndrobwllllantysiliogogogochensis]|nr:hypothetical protein [Myxococcus llanfairpwllgwyngyllgogerychwyrndrobwllllantysiliogogogochensis]